MVGGKKGMGAIFPRLQIGHAERGGAFVILSWGGALVTVFSKLG